MHLQSLAVLTSLALAAPLLAAEQDDPLEGNVKFGYLATTGNTETSSLNTSFEAKYVADDWHHEAMASAINASENKVTSAEAYEAG
jgi:putative salt-induced outer membrane protein